MLAETLPPEFQRLPHTFYSKDDAPQEGLRDGHN
jgi:hypothetical protein